MILAPTDPTDTKELFETIITGRDKFNDLGGVGNEVNISSLLEAIQESENDSCGCVDLDLVECTHQACTKIVLRNYIATYISDFNADGFISCDDAAILLYVGHEVTVRPISIRCSFFWSIYRRNVAFLKQSTGEDINQLEIYPRGETKISPRRNSSNSLRELDDDLYLCRNGQCKFGFFGKRIVPCDGFVDCTDTSDEENCEFCPSVKCLISGIPTCLQEDQVCIFSPERCWYSNNTELSLAKCNYHSAKEKFNECKRYLDKYFRDTFGVHSWEGYTETTPKESYRNMLCRGNYNEIDKGMDLEEALETIPPSIRDFKFLNFNQSFCQEKVRIAKCHLINSQLCRLCRLMVY